MTNQKKQVQEMFLSGLTVQEIHKVTGIPDRTVRHYVVDVRKVRANLITPNVIKTDPTFKQLSLTIKNGVIIGFSDAHIIPGQKLSVAQSGMLNVAKDVKATHILDLGDGVDFSSISSHDAFGFEKKFTVAEELQAYNEYLDLVKSVTKNAKHYMLTSNHNIRFNKFLAKHAPQMKGVPMFSFEEQIKGWEHCLSIMINNEMIFLHQFNGGVHAGYNNTLKGGISVVTGHTHIMEVKPFTDYRGTRWGVQTGTLATIKDNPLFNYTLGTPLNWLAGFVVITIIDGVIQQPELATVGNDGKLFFRGKHYS